MIRDSLSEEWGSRQCHQITQGGGRGLTKVSHDICYPFLNNTINSPNLKMLSIFTLKAPKKCHTLFEWTI
jgi:hypothetical protein